jgi:N-acetylmuramoyl-L-alanine amidase.
MHLLTDYSPAQVGFRVNYDSWDRGPWAPDKWVVHYGGGANSAGSTPFSVDAEMRKLRSWESYHIDGKGWSGIAYNYAIGQTGNTYRLRGENRSGATSGDYEGDGIPENVEARAVVFILGGDQKPSEAALQAFRELWAQDPMPVIGHQDVRGASYTPCPGPHLMQFIREEAYADMETITYRDVKNVPNTRWAKNVIDYGIESGLIVTGDDYVDDWQDASLTMGRLWTLFHRAFQVPRG